MGFLLVLGEEHLFLVEGCLVIVGRRIGKEGDGEGCVIWSCKNGSG